MASNVVLSNEEFNVVGSRPIRHDGNDKVTGRARYSADITLPRLLHGKILRSPHAHAKINSIDTSKALALDGVLAVVTSADFAQPGGRATAQISPFPGYSMGRFCGVPMLTPASRESTPVKPWPCRE